MSRSVSARAAWTTGRLDRFGRPRSIAYLAAVGAVSLLYFGSAKVGLSLAFANPSATAIWPPTGIALAVIFLGGFRMWPAVALGAFLANVTTQGPLGSVLGITLGNTVEALVGACLLRRAGFRPSLDRTRDVLALATLAAFLSTTLSATVGVTSLWLGNAVAEDTFGSVWRTWWLGDAGGDLIVASALFVLASQWANRTSRLTRPQTLGLATSAAVMVGLGALLFSRPTQLAYLLFPLLFWMALRYRQLGAAVAGLTLSGLAIYFTARGQGPFAGGSPDNELLRAQMFGSVAALTGLLVAAVRSERERAEQELEQAARRMERLYEGEQEARRMAEEAKGRLRKLEAVTQIGLAARSLDQLLDDLLPFLRDLLGGDRAALFLLDEESQELRVRGAVGFQDEVQPQLSVPLGGSIVGRIAATNQAQLVDHVSSADPGSTLREGSGSLIAAPLAVGGCVLGVLQVSSDRPRAFDERDLRLLQLAGARAALALEQISLYEHEHEVAVTLQRSVLPAELPRLRQVELAARYVPGSAGVEVGGDWYDVIELDEGSIGIAVGDVVGKGVLAAATMMQLRNALRVYALEGLRPATVLARLGRLVETTGPSFATLLYAVLDTETFACRYACAGHPPPLLLHAETGVARFLEGGRSVPLGLRGRWRYRQDVVELQPGDLLLLYTDGLVERRGQPIEDGLAGLRHAVETGPVDLDSLLDYLMLELAESSDDVAVLAVRAAPEICERLQLRFPASPASLARMRSAVRAWILESGADRSLAEEVVIACSEACANAVEHASEPSRGEFELMAKQTLSEIVVCVRDFGRWREPENHLDRGRGLQLMREFMDQVEVRPHESGTEVQMRRRLHSPLSLPA